jgi:hypothetical protein
VGLSLEVKSQDIYAPFPPLVNYETQPTAWNLFKSEYPSIMEKMGPSEAVMLAQVSGLFAEVFRGTGFPRCAKNPRKWQGLGELLHSGKGSATEEPRFLSGEVGQRSNAGNRDGESAGSSSDAFQFWAPEMLD